MIKTSVLIIFCFLYFSSGNTMSVNESLESGTAISNSTLTKSNEQSLNNNDGCGFDNEVSSLGVGLVIAPSKFETFYDSLLLKKYRAFDMSSSESKLFCPKFSKPDYGIMHFVCIAITDKTYSVLINETDIKYMPRENSYEFKTWDEYILQSYGIRRKFTTVNSTQPLKSEPNETDESLVVPKGLELFCPIEIKGDWVKVSYDCFYNLKDNNHRGEPCHEYIASCAASLTGWIKWRKDNHLLIDIFLKQ